MRIFNKNILVIILIFIAIQCAVNPTDSRKKTVDQEQIIENISTADAYQMIVDNKTNNNFIIIDVRTPGEFSNGHIENALNIDYYADNFENDLNTLDKSLVYLIYCRSGGRSGQALNQMEELKFNTVYNMLGGMNQWTALEYPVVN